MPAILDLGTLKLEVKVLNDDAAQKLDQTAQKTEETKVKLEDVGKSLIKTGENLTKFVTLPILAAAAASVKFATDMAETTSKIGVVFDDNAAVVERWAASSIKNMGLARQTAMDAASTYGDMGKGMGLAEDAVLSMSTSLVQLAADMASFKNISVDRALVALNGVYTGETEALKGLGIVMTQANLQQFALNQGIATQISDMTQAELVTLRYQYVMSVTADAQGDFARTGGGVANQSRMVTENLKELGTQAGEVLLPIVNEALVSINGLLKTLQQLTPEQREAAVTTALIVAGIGPLLIGVGKAITAYQSFKSAITAANTAGAAASGPTGWISLAAAAGIALATIITTQVIAAYKDFYSESIKLEEATKKALKSAEDAGVAYQESSDETLAAATAAEKYLDRLDELNVAGKLTVEQQAEYRSIVNTLNGLIPDLNLKISEQTGKLMEGTGAIRDQIESWKELAIAQAAQQYLADLTSQYTELLIAQAEAEIDLKEIKDERADAENRQAEIAQKLYNLTGKTVDELSQLSAANRNNARDTDFMTDEVRKLWTEYTQLNVTLDGCDKKIEKLSATMLDNDAAVAAMAEQMGKTEEAVRSMMERVADGTATEEEIEEIGAAFDDLGYAVDEVNGIIADFTSIARNMFDELSMKSKMSIDDMIKNLQKNQKALTDWSSNLETLGQRITNEGFMDYLRSLGPEYGLIIQAMVDATPEKLNELVTAWTAGGASAFEAAKDLGYNLAAGVAAGVDSGVPIATKSMAGMMNSVMNEARMVAMIKSPSKRAEKEIGIQLPAGVGVGIEEGMGDVLDKMTAGIDNVIVGASSYTQKATAEMQRDMPPYQPLAVPYPQPAAPGITQQIYITSPTPLSASQIARESKNALRRAMWDAQ